MVGTIESAAGGGGAGAGLTVTAKSLAFDTGEIDLPAGQPTTLTFDNQDAGIPHNIAIYTDDSLSTVLFQGEQFPGVDSREYQIPPLDPGTYFFHCDVHNTMKGSVVVGPPGGGTGPDGTASGATGTSPPG
jgi:plastocyanin